MCCSTEEQNKSLNNEQEEKIDAIVDQYDDYQVNLISILQKIQGELNFISKSAIEYLANKTKISESKIFGVVTFYSQFRMAPIGENLILLCQGTACHVNGSEKIEETIKEYLNIDIGETTDDNLFTLTNVACLGCCSLAPVMMIKDTTYGHLTPEKTREILQSIRDEA